MKVLVSLVIILGICTIVFAVSTVVLAVKYSGLKNSENRPTTTTPKLPTPTTPDWTTEPPITTTPEWTTDPPITTTPEWTTEPPIITTPEWTTEPPITTTPEWTTDPPITTIPPTKEDDSIVHDGTTTAITLDTIDAIITEISSAYVDTKLEVFVESSQNGLELLHRLTFTLAYQFDIEQLDHLNIEFNINFEISDNDFDEFVDTVVSFIRKPNFLTIRTQAEKYIYRNYEILAEDQLGLTMNYDTVPTYIPNISGHYNGTKWIVRIRSIAESNDEAGFEQQKKLVNLNDERCTVFRFWIDDNFSVATISKFLEKHNTGTMTTVTLTYDIKHGSQIYFNRLYVNLKNELNSDHLRNWNMKVDFYSNLFANDPIYNGNDKAPSIIFERA